MLYKFKSKAGGDVIMLGPDGDRVLSLLGRVPAAQGIFEVAALPDAMARLRAAVQADETPATDAAEAPADAAGAPQGEPAVGLRRRLWPLQELLQRAQAAGQPVVWGV